MPGKRKKIKSASKTKTVSRGEHLPMEIEKGLDPKLFEGEPASVHFSLGATINTAPYETARIDVGITLPCSPQTPAILAAMKSAKKEVEEIIYKEIQEIRKNCGVSS